MTISEESDRRPAAALASVVLFVHDLQRSVGFYETVMALDVTVRAESAALLVTAHGFQLYLREMGAHAEHAVGSVGAQYVVWTAANTGDLDRFETILKELGAHIATTSTDGITVVEGRDPSGLPVLMVHPGPERVPRQHMMKRIYLW